MRNVSTQTVKCRIRHKCNIVSHRIEDERVLVDDLLDGSSIRCSNTRQIATVSARTAKLNREIIPRGNARSSGGTAVTILSGLKYGGSEWRFAIFGKACEQRVDGECTCALAEDGNFGCITTKRVDVSLNPVKCETLVEEAEISSCQW